MEKGKKKSIVEKFSRNPGDTGSSEVQVAVLTERINEISEHLKIHKKDSSSRRGLIAMVNLRRHLLAYLGKKDHDKYLKLTEELNIRRK